VFKYHFQEQVNKISLKIIVEYKHQFNNMRVNSELYIFCQNATNVTEWF